ncbi:MAG TPA: CBM20 domain-containing protein [Kiritimatiellia bacterium]|jgi:hypothetical protein
MIATPATKKRTERTVSFEIKTAKPLSVGEQVFIAGNVSMLGAWRPDGFPLTRMGEDTWFGSAILPNDIVIEFKVTRGSWDDEEVQEDGSAPPNAVLKPGGDVSVRRSVTGWKDGR